MTPESRDKLAPNAPKAYQCRCWECRELFIGHKRDVRCALCENKAQVVAAALSTPFDVLTSAAQYFLANNMLEDHRRMDGAISALRAALAPTGGEAEQLQTERDAQRYQWLRARGAPFPSNFPKDGTLYHRELDAAIDAAMGVHLAAPQSVRTSGEALGTVPSAQGWLPIETAPKDGTKLLAWLPWVSEATVAHWTTNGNRSRMGAGWVCRFTGFSSRVAGEPTHWMPLPPAPGALTAASPEVLPASPDVQDPSDGGNQQ